MNPWRCSRNGSYRKHVIRLSNFLRSVFTHRADVSMKDCLGNTVLHHAVNSKVLYTWSKNDQPGKSTGTHSPRYAHSTILLAGLACIGSTSKMPGRCTCMGMGIWILETLHLRTLVWAVMRPYHIGVALRCKELSRRDSSLDMPSRKRSARLKQSNWTRGHSRCTSGYREPLEGPKTDRILHGSFSGLYRGMFDAFGETSGIGLSANSR